ncbi:hypothetical protein FCI23_25885 [Actinacidiphila oryziradicis]|uniref:Uncharacterized protein n=1 Tax=Actinacidiphila oryziradicis TaxID=2571141 RepID=A0A4U0SH01_9ACTN|nr:hypothetical protein FCI23_25885 [Actinacidiphila oryziradicis]
MNSAVSMRRFWHPRAGQDIATPKPRRAEQSPEQMKPVSTNTRTSAAATRHPGNGKPPAWLRVCSSTADRLVNSPSGRRRSAPRRR